MVREGRVDVTLELPGCACCLSLVDCRQGGALLGMQDESGGKDIVCALDNGEVQVPPPFPSHLSTLLVSVAIVTP